MPSELLISCLTAQIKPHDQRIFGWPDKCAFLQHLQGKYSMADWLKHEQNQVISTATTRMSDYGELCELHMHLPGNYMMSTAIVLTSSSLLNLPYILILVLVWRLATDT